MLCTGLNNLLPYLPQASVPPVVLQFCQCTYCVYTWGASAHPDMLNGDHISASSWLLKQGWQEAVDLAWISSAIWCLLALESQIPPRFITKALALQIKTIDNSGFLHRNAKIREHSFFLLTASSSPIWHSVCSDWTHIPLEAVTHANSCYSLWSKYNLQNLSWIVTLFHLNVFYLSAVSESFFPFCVLNTFLFLSFFNDCMMGLITADS